MKRKYLAILIIPFIVLLVLSSLEWYKVTGFYKDCHEVHVGMSEANVMQLMGKYIQNKKRFEISSSSILDGPGIYISAKFSNYQCNITINNGAVTKVAEYFE
jgi:hypothetical protein